MVEQRVNPKIQRRTGFRATLGPWELRTGGVLGDIILVGIPERHAIAKMYPPKNAKQEANARLIAAAPDLLDAATKCLAQFDRATMFDADTSPFSLLRAVIVKATGEQP